MSAWLRLHVKRTYRREGLVYKTPTSTAAVVSWEQLEIKILRAMDADLREKETVACAVLLLSGKGGLYSCSVRPSLRFYHHRRVAHVFCTEYKERTATTLSVLQLHPSPRPCENRQPNTHTM